MKLERMHFAMIIAVILLIVIAIGILRPVAPTGLPIQAQAILRLNITVPEAACILNLNFSGTGSTNSTRYGISGRYTLIAGESSDELSINFTNAGNARHQVTLNASFWYGPNDSHSIYCNRTRYHNTSGTAWASSSDTCGGASGASSLGLQARNISNLTYLRVAVPDADDVAGNLAAASGEHNQNISLTISNCGI